MVGDPLLREAVKFVELRLGIVFWIVAHINPVKEELLDLVAGKVRVSFQDALNGLLKIEPFCVWPDQFALLGVELRLLQQVPEDVADLDGFLALWRVHPLKESIEERVIREDTVLRLFPALLAHEVLKQVWAVAARFVLARRRVLRDIHCAVKTPEYSSPPIPAMQLVSSYPDHEPNHG
jgi:hypothetical protein